MLESFREGGWGMYPTTILGLVTLVAALRFAFRVDPKLKGFVLSMCNYLLFSSLCAFVTGLLATNNHIERHGLKGEEIWTTLLMGTMESMHNLALGFTLLSLIHLVVAVGQRRLDSRVVD